MTQPFRCPCCGKTYDGIPAYHADRPAPYWDVPENKRQSDVFLTSDSCVIADRFYFVHGLIHVPIREMDQFQSWGVWVSLSEPNFSLWQDHYEVAKRSHIGPFFGWLCSLISVYPETMHLKTMMHLQNDGIRPSIVLEVTDHPLSVDQHQGITIERAMEFVHQIESQNQKGHDVP